MSTLTSLPPSSGAGVAAAVRPTTRVTVLPHPDLCPDGVSFEARSGRKLLDEMLSHGIELEHACEKVCACATCHVYLREGAEHVRPADDEEEDQLDAAWGLQAQSRLSCCVKVQGPALVVELPRFTRNHARER
ncbi:2Fe-2S ferredoxin [Sphaerotilus hippei]|uniref:2Fe-2S ferredoxin n=1 Tax=Sphaerotilus hippei TaxID=744406 RepID=A0A318H520_9BURK|nr:ISC system 2Fe-2S type ferredoxin [Sphaerotilus hippei]PXW94307.1 2Fe-2S ferredoxin [Sphaerotilus hippei]